MSAAKRQDIDRTPVANALLKLRIHEGLSQADFAARLGVPKSTYVTWERADCEPPLRLIFAMKNTLGSRAVIELLKMSIEEWGGGAPVDWRGVGHIATRVSEIAEQHGLRYSLADLIAIAGIAFEKGKDGLEAALIDVERLMVLVARHDSE